VQRVVVRMLYDAAFVDAAHSRPDEILGSAGLGPEERAWVLAVDRRAWRTDPLRRRRTLRTLSEEFKASTTLALAETRSLAFLDGYFSSPQFHAAVAERRSIALAFGDYLEAAALSRLTTPQLRDVVRLEKALARCRREARRAGSAPAAVGLPRFLRLAPGHAVLDLEANVIATVNRVEQYLFEVGLMPAVALCEDAPRLAGLPPVSTERAFLLVFPSGAGASLSLLDPALYDVLSHAADGVAAEALTLRYARRGVSRATFEETLASLVAEGLLTGS
jgi:hypothetical protein